MDWLSDSVHAVRLAAVANLKQLAEVFGSAWAASNVIPTVRGVMIISTSSFSNYPLNKPHKDTNIMDGNTRRLVTDSSYEHR